ncbi:hypothetical protein [Streptomyces phaeochromogenes]|nr:hypothetical protein OG277_34945 [Streptomyces phaeochromogenes]
MITRRYGDLEIGYTTIRKVSAEEIKAAEELGIGPTILAHATEITQ